jgi:hypothetical protein
LLNKDSLDSRARSEVADELVPEGGGLGGRDMGQAEAVVGDLGLGRCRGIPWCSTNVHEFFRCLSQRKIAIVIEQNDAPLSITIEI